MNKDILFFFIYQFIQVLSQICIENEHNCKICDPFNKLCHECVLDIFIPDEKGGCIGGNICKIGNNYCEECNDEGNLCEKCEIGYFPDENGGCAYSDNCQISYKGECVQCKNDYILIGQNTTLKICKSIFNQDFKNCKIINITTGQCNSCEGGYFLNEGDKRCILTDKCYKSNFGICINCISSYYLDKKENKCKRQENDFLHCVETIDEKNCDKCETNYYFDKDGKCVSTNFCSKSKNFECKECISGYYLAEDKSCSTEINCKSAYRDKGICNWCSNNHYLNLNNKCVPYSESEIELLFCKILTDKCIKCDNNYTFDEEGKCVNTKNCAESDEGICTLCSKGYYLGYDKKCTNKQHCIYSNDDYLCIECEDNYYLDNPYKTCKPVDNITKFENCKLSYTGFQCSSCKKGFYLNNSDLLCYNNNINNKYYKCSRVVAGICNECEEGYFFGYGDYLCSKVEFCLKSQDENSCIQCRPDYCLDGKTKSCIYNKKINKNINYYRCLKTDEEGLCQECENGSNLKNGLCFNDEDCIEKDGDSCIKCVNKDENLYSCLNNIFGCVETAVPNCVSCNDLENLNKCTKCEDGFELDEEGNCIQN